MKLNYNLPNYGLPDNPETWEDVEEREVKRTPLERDVFGYLDRIKDKADELLRIKGMITWWEHDVNDPEKSDEQKIFAALRLNALRRDEEQVRAELNAIK